MSEITARTLEAVSFRAWPAAEVERLDGWILRFSSGVSRRANSVWPNECAAHVDLETRVAGAEDFYRIRGARAVFQVGPAATPADLDAVLDARGYAVDAPTLVLASESEAVLAHTSEGEAGTSAVTGEVTEPWFDISGRRGRYAGHEAFYRALLERIGPRAGYALTTLDGQPAAVGLGVYDPPWMGVFSMSTLPAFRRRGAASAILRALAGWGLDRGASRLYLQVEASNEAASALYRRIGFEEVYGYHYRVSEIR